MEPEQFLSEFSNVGNPPWQLKHSLNLIEKPTLPDGLKEYRDLREEKKWEEDGYADHSVIRDPDEPSISFHDGEFLPETARPAVMMNGLRFHDAPRGNVRQSGSQTEFQILVIQKEGFFEKARSGQRSRIDPQGSPRTVRNLPAVARRRCVR